MHIKVKNFDTKVIQVTFPILLFLLAQYDCNHVVQYLMQTLEKFVQLMILHLNSFLVLISPMVLHEFYALSTDYFPLDPK